MDIESAREIFVSWIARRMTEAGRGDAEHSLSVEPSGKYWLGRLQPVESVAQSNWGDRGERLEPCALGIKIKPSKRGPWQLNLNASVRAWKWVKSKEKWEKRDAAKVQCSVQVLPELGVQPFAEDQFKRALEQTVGTSGLAARIDVEVDTDSQGAYEVSISLINTSPNKHPKLLDTRLYECELMVRGVQTKPFLLESLEDSFRYNREVQAYGINCGVICENGWIKTEDAITVDRARPKYWNASDPVPSMTFSTLANDPLPPAEKLLAALKSWGIEHWGAATLDRRAKEEGWSESMRKSASLAAREFEQEFERVAEGVRLLKSDPELRASFQGMNRAMRHSAAGKYDSWRPFQFGFLLANLATISNPDLESNVVDVVWFATGGGKTETYLGLLVTAALHDRMTGKTTGITAWSRFPLRMLSLQQTQRFADAIAAAELVRREMRLEGDSFSLGFFVGQGATPNKFSEDPKAGDPDPDDVNMPGRYQILDQCPFCHRRSIDIRFDRLHWRLEHHCLNSKCESAGEALPVYVIDEEIYRFLPTIIVGTLDKAASISIQASMRGFVGAPLGLCSKDGHGYTYASRSNRPNGCLVPGCRGSRQPLPMDKQRYGLSFRLQDELHLLRDSLGAVDSHYEALYDGLQYDLCGRKPKILASSATLSGYEKQVDALYRRSARIFPVPPPRSGTGFWTADSNDLMRRFVAIAPRGVTIEYTVDRLLTELQIVARELANDPVGSCTRIGVDPSYAPDLLSLYGTNVVYGNTLRDLEAVTRSIETQVLVPGKVRTASLTGKTNFTEVRETLDRLQNPETSFEDRLHIISASSMMSHGVDVDRLNIMVMLGIPLSAAEFIQATARVGRKFPGIVFVVHKIGRERDAGVFRSFPQFVSQGDRFVEPIPITKRSRRVLERTIAGLQLARLLMIHEPDADRALTTVTALKQFALAGNFELDSELEAVIATLELTTELDDPLKQDLIKWFDELRRNIDVPPSGARFPSDLSPTGSPMKSLRDVETQVPVIGTRT